MRRAAECALYCMSTCSVGGGGRAPEPLLGDKRAEVRTHRIALFTTVGSCVICFCSPGSFTCKVTSPCVWPV